MANQPQNQLLSIQQGVNAQSWAGVAMAEGNTSIGNSNMSQPITGPNPEDAAGHPGYLAAGQPGGANVVIIPNTNGNGAAGANLQTNAPNAGTAGGGGQYPAAASGASGNPMLIPGWTIQNSGGSDINDDSPDLTVAINPEYTFSHTVGGTVTPTISGGTAPLSVVLVESAANGANTNATLPTGITLTATTGVLTISSTTSAAGTYQLGFRVSDSSTPAKFDTYTVTIVLT